MTHAIKADLILITVALLAAAGWVFSKEALVGLPPLLFIGLRFFAAGVILILSGKTRLNSLKRPQLQRALLSAVTFAGALCVWIFGLHHSTHLGVGAFITSLAVILVPVFSFLLYRERPEASNWWALPVALAGLALLTLKDGLHWEGGQLFFVIAALVFAFQFTYTSQIVRQMSAIALTAIQLLMVGVVALGLSTMFETWPEQVSGSVWGWLVLSTLLATCMRFFLQVYAQSLAPASHTAVILILEPVLTSMLAAFWFGEQMVLMQFFGCVLIFLALLIARWKFVRAMFRSLRAQR